MLIPLEVLCFRVRGFGGWRVGRPVSGFAKSQSLKLRIGENFIRSQPLLNISGFDNLSVAKTRGRVSCIRKSRSHEMQYNCGGGRGRRFQQFDISGFGGLKSQKLDNRIREVAKPEILKGKEKSRFGKGHDQFI
jgi:hypothetical protein